MFGVPIIGRNSAGLSYGRSNCGYIFDDSGGSFPSFDWEIICFPNGGPDFPHGSQFGYFFGSQAINQNLPS